MRKGFTTIEVLVAMSIFTIAAVIATNLLVDVVNLEKKSSVQNEVYEDARILMQQLTKEIQNGTIDYEEYYSIEVAQAPLGIIPTGGPFYGINYGVYASRFYDPGKQLSGVATINPSDLGVECSFPNPPLPLNTPCEIVFNLSSDFDTGQNPYKKPGNTATWANALCDKDGIICATSNEVDELYLIDATGTKKTIIGRKLMKDVPAPAVDDYSIGIMKMKGVDFDQNGITDIFSCTEEFKCEAKNFAQATAMPRPVYPFLTRLKDTVDDPAAFIDKFNALNVRLPKTTDLGTVFNINDSQFLPISPLKSNVKQLKFILNPLEDPYKAYAEKDMRTQPSVTIIMTIGLSAAATANYPGKFQDITVQTTVGAGVIGKIDSYPPVNDFIRDGVDKSWIFNVLPLGVGSVNQ